MTDRLEKSPLLLVIINGALLLLLGITLALLFMKTGTVGQPAREGGQEPAASMVSGYAETTVTMSLIDRALGELDPSRREKTLADPALFDNFVRDHVVRRAVLAAAGDDNLLQENPNLLYRMETVAEQVLIDQYLKGRLDTGLSTGFPSEKQMREFYREKQSRYLLRERLHVWQIFFTLPASAPGKEVKRVTSIALALVKRLKAGEVGFSKVATQYSEHEPSRSNGGYLGVFEVSQLYPGLKETLLGLDEGMISNPVRSDTGVHILKRGAKISGRTLSFEQVRDKIREEMRASALTDLRKRMLDDIYGRYGEPVPESALEEWRMELGRFRSGISPLEQN